MNGARIYVKNPKTLQYCSPFHVRPVITHQWIKNMHVRTLVLAICTIIIIASPKIALAGNDEIQATISFANTVFEKFHFDEVATNLSVAHVKGRMTSMEGATCLKNGEEKKSVYNLLLNTGRFDADITTTVVEVNLRKSLREWAFGSELVRMKESERKELLAIPSNSISDSIITQWLWSRFDIYGGPIELNKAAQASWQAICTKYYKSGG